MPFKCGGVGEELGEIIDRLLDLCFEFEEEDVVSFEREEQILSGHESIKGRA